MVTALDTNVIITLLSADKPVDIKTAQNALETASNAGSLTISPVVYSELLAAPQMTESFLASFLASTHIATEWRHPQVVWRSAAAAYKIYADKRRRSSKDPGPRRILADFMVGAHALYYADSLITFDTRIFQTAFPELRVTVLEAT